MWLVKLFTKVGYARSTGNWTGKDPTEIEGKIQRSYLANDIETEYAEKSEENLEGMMSRNLNGNIFKKGSRGEVQSIQRYGI